MLRQLLVSTSNLTRTSIRSYATRSQKTLQSNLANSSPRQTATPPPKQESTPIPTLSPKEPVQRSHPTPFDRPEPPFVKAAREKSVKQRNVWESYLVLDPKIRLYFSLAVMAFAGIGLWAGDRLVPLTEEEKEANELAK